MGRHADHTQLHTGSSLVLQVFTRYIVMLFQDWNYDRPFNTNWERKSTWTHLSIMTQKIKRMADLMKEFWNYVFFASYTKEEAGVGVESGLRGRLTNGASWSPVVPCTIPATTKIAWRENSDGELGGGFKYCLFSPYLGRWSNLTSIFQTGWNHQPENLFDGHPYFCSRWAGDNLRLVDRWWLSPKSNPFWWMWCSQVWLTICMFFILYRICTEYTVYWKFTCTLYSYLCCS